MSNFAKIVDGLVVDVIVADQEFIDTLPDAGQWVHALESPTKGHQAGKGDFYDPSTGFFTKPQPYPSWTQDANLIWQPPSPKPDGYCWWDEATQKWCGISETSGA